MSFTFHSLVCTHFIVAPLSFGAFSFLTVILIIVPLSRIFFLHIRICAAHTNFRHKMEMKMGKKKWTKHFNLTFNCIKCEIIDEINANSMTLVYIFDLRKVLTASKITCTHKIGTWVWWTQKNGFMFADQFSYEKEYFVSVWSEKESISRNSLVVQACTHLLMVAMKANSGKSKKHTGKNCKFNSN